MKLKIVLLLLALSPIELTEVQKLKADNFQLKIQLGNCKLNLQSKEFVEEQGKLIEEFRKQLQANPTDLFDWSCYCFKSK